MKLKTALLSIAFAAISYGATIDQWKLTEVETNGYTYEAGPFIGYSAYLNFYEPFFQANPQTYLTWGYTSCPDPCMVNAPHLTNPLPDGDHDRHNPPNAPEPSTLLMASAGLVLLMRKARR